MYIVVLVTTSNQKEAEKIAQKLLKNRLAACVNIMPKIHSKFQWKGRIENSTETLMIIKSKSALFDQLVDTVKSSHSYQVPEILALPVRQGFKKYLHWIDTVTEQKRPKRQESER